MSYVYTRLERQLALTKLESWIEASRHDADRERALNAFHASLAGAAPEEDILRGLQNPNLESLLVGWLYYDVPIGRGPCPALGLLESGKGAKLPPGSRRYLGIMGRSVLGVYEIVGVDPGRSLKLRALLGEGEFVVQERRGSQQLAEGDVLGARVIEGGEGKLELEDVILLPGDVEEAEERIQDFLMSLAETEGTGGRLDLASKEAALAAAKLIAPYLAYWWIEGNYGEPALENLVPAVVNGEVFEPGVAEYALGRRSPPLGALAEIPGMEEVEPGVWNLYDRVEGGRRIVGTVSRGGVPGVRPTLVLKTPGRTSMASLRRAVKAIFGRSLTHLRTSYEEPRMVRAERGGSIETYETAVDFAALGIDPKAPDAMAQAERAVRQQFLDRWPDEAVPALDGATPRQAARRPETRPAVVRLLREYESMALAQAERERVEPLDFGRIWRTLGLDRPLADQTGA